jgi:SAM-dependent methyltransferase
MDTKKHELQHDLSRHSCLFVSIRGSVSAGFQMLNLQCEAACSIQTEQSDVAHRNHLSGLRQIPFRHLFRSMFAHCNPSSKADATMPSAPENQVSSDDIDAVVEAAGHSRPDSDARHQGVRQPQDSLAEIESLEHLLREADAHPSPEAPIPEHPAVSLVTGDPPVTTSACIACHATSARRLYSIEGVSEELVECENCGLGSLYPMPTAERIRSFYPAEYYGEPTAKFEPLVEFGVRLGAKMRVESLVGDLPARSKVLDIGCGRGVMLRALLDLGHEAHGVEIAPEAASGADSLAQIRIAPELAKANYKENTFDAVIMWHVLEHLPHPEQTLAEIRRILRPGGRLILAVPNFGSLQSQRTGHDWFHLDLPRHLYHFTPETLQRLLACNEFHCESVRHMAMLQNSFGWLQSILNRISGTPRNSLYSLLHRGGEHPVVKNLSRLQRWQLKLGYWIGLPIAAAVSLLETATQQGGTIAVTATLGRSTTPNAVVTNVQPLAVQPAFA